MPTEVVVDSSVIAAIVTPEEHFDWATKRISEHDFFHISDLNYYEVANALKHKTSDGCSAKIAAKAFTHTGELMNLYSS